jgi:hypothetical protein
MAFDVSAKEFAFMSVCSALEEWFDVTGIEPASGALIIAVRETSVDLQWFGKYEISEDAVPQVLKLCIERVAEGNYSVDTNAALRWGDTG